MRKCPLLRLLQAALQHEASFPSTHNQPVTVLLQIHHVAALQTFAFDQDGSLGFWACFREPWQSCHGKWMLERAWRSPAMPSR